MKRILVVEDEPSIANAIEYALKTEGFAVSLSQTGADALTRMKEEDPALIILDVGLPDTTGFELCKQIRASSAVPILFLTARSDEVDRVVGFEIGADDYVVKPFSPRELSARVRAILRRVDDSQPNSPDSSSSTPFVVDSERYEISYFGKPVELTRYEFKLLSVLIGRPGRVFTREELMNRVWDSPDSSMERTVDSHIKTIRAQLKTISPEIDPIVTHRGVGYALREEW